MSFISQSVPISGRIPSLSLAADFKLVSLNGEQMANLPRRYNPSRPLMPKAAKNIDSQVDTPHLEHELLRSLIDHIPDVVYLKDTQSRFLIANAAAARLFGVNSIDEMIGKTDFDFFPEDLAKVYFEDEAKILSTGQPLRSKREKGINALGEHCLLSVTKTPIRDKEGTIVGIAGIGRDITESVEAKQEAEIEREQLQTLIDNIPDLIYFKDAESRYVNGNVNFYRALDAKSFAEVAGKSDHDFYDPEIADAFRRDEKQLIETGQGFTKEESYTDPMGKVAQYKTTKTPIFKPHTPNPIGMVGISRDITEIKRNREELHARAEELSQALVKLKEAQSHLVQSEKLVSLGVLTAGIAHEINNPINFVYAGVNSMAKDFQDVKAVVEELKRLPESDQPAEAIAQLEQKRREVDFDEAFEAMEETLKDIKLGATRITEIVAGLSKFSRLGQEDQELTNLHDDLDSVLVLLKNKYKTHIRIEKDFDPELPDIVCFPGKLNQAFMNIIGNAIDAIDAHSSEGGTINIATRHDAASAYVTVSDDGIGMDENVSSRIFDPFFTTKSIGKGTGLGLSITHSIVQDHQGKLSLETAPGKGSTFTIEIPYQKNPSAESQP